MSRIDSKFAALREQGFTGAVSDMTLQWLQANGATSNQISDAWLEMLADQGYTGQRNDAWFQFLGDRGYEGAYPDREAAFWEDGGIIEPPEGTEYFHDFTTGDIGDWNHTRGSIATAPDTDGIIQTYTGDEPAFYRDQGLQLEAASSNYIRIPSELENWTENVGDPVININNPAPDGTNTAREVNLDNTDTQYLRYVTGGHPPTSPVNPSFWVYDVAGEDFNVHSAQGSWSGSLTVDASLLPSAEWVRVDVNNPAVTIVTPWLSDAGGNLGLQFHAATSTDAVLRLWGCQTEDGEIPTSFIPADGGIATRNDTNCQATFAELGEPLPPEGVTNNFCGQVVFVLPTDSAELEGGLRPLYLDDGGNDNRLIFNRNAGTWGLEFITQAGGNVTVTVLDLSLPSIPVAGDTVDLRFKLSSSEGLTYWVNGIRENNPSPIYGFSAGVFNNFLGAGRGRTFPFNANYSNIRIVPEALSDEEIEGWS